MTFGMIRSQLEVLGTPIGADDLQIAAIPTVGYAYALTNNLTLIIHNTREFNSVELPQSAGSFATFGILLRAASR